METQILAMTAGYILLRLALLAGIGYAAYAILRRRALFAVRPAMVRARS